MFRRIAKRLLRLNKEKPPARRKPQPKQPKQPSAQSIQRPRYNERADELEKKNIIISNGIEASGSEVREWQANGEVVHIVDIREEHEYRSGVVEDALFIPMNTVPHRLDELPEEGHLVIYCAAGMRSLSVAEWLRSNGRPKAVSLQGGVGALLGR
jgi:rhodanese-related sulfurtransferase